MNLGCVMRSVVAKIVAILLVGMQVFTPSLGFTSPPNYSLHMVAHPVAWTGGFKPALVHYPSQPRAQVVAPLLPPPGVLSAGASLLSQPAILQSARPLQLRDPRAAQNIRPSQNGTQPTPLPQRIPLGQAQSRLSTSSSIRLMSSPTMPPAQTGAFPWWTIVTAPISGVGNSGINIANGNLALSSADLTATNKDAPFAFARAYNSMSGHDYVGTDGSTPSNYGNGWTNTWDAHMGYNSALGIISVYDSSGTRYDYTGSNGSWTPPPGVQATLTWDGANGYYWQMKSGVVFYFYSPTQTSSNMGYAGRLSKIFGRNTNNNLVFAYSWDNANASSSATLNKITVTAEDGRAATLQFANFGTFRLLSTLTWLDGTQVSYAYDNAAHLTQVSEPTNVLNGQPIPHQYTYLANGFLQSVLSPNWVHGQGGFAAAGSNVTFSYNAQNQATNVSYTGVVNFDTGDGTSSLLQPLAPSGVQTYRALPISYNSGSTQITDTDGHNSTYSIDGYGRVNQIAATTGSTTLTTSQGWYSPPDLRAHRVSFTKDARGNETDLAYDNNGNLIAIGAPQTTTSAGTFRPTSYFSYDVHNNLTGACDPVNVNSRSANWTATPAATASLCPAGTGASTQLTWTPPADGSEPFGQLMSIKKPSGYVTTFSYSASSQGGLDYGLATSLTGASFTQLDGTQVTPSGTFIYDVHGNLICRSNGLNRWSVMQYSTPGQLLAVGDADDGSLSGSACGKTAGPYQSATYFTYAPDGRLLTLQTSAQRNTYPYPNISYTYDPDGNLTSIGGDTPYGASYMYDGDDRLVEVGLPYDSNDYFTQPWLTRYLYDLTKGQGSVNIGDPTYGAATYLAHGNLYKTQKYLTAALQHGPTQFSLYSWMDVSGSSYDGLNRPLKSYFYQPGGNLQVTSRSYDASGNLGLLTTVTNALQDVATLAYDPLGRVTSFQSSASPSGGSLAYPTRNLVYDPAGRVASVATAAYGMQSYTYNADGTLNNSVEPAGGSGTTQYPASGSPSSPATLTYAYYPNGWESALSVTSSGFTQANLKTFTYRDDARVLSGTLNYGSNSYKFGYTYTTGGRLATQVDPYATSTPAISATYDSFGRLRTERLPQGKYDQIGYTTSGQMTGYVAKPAPTVSPKTLAYTYDVRGELIAKQVVPTPFPGPSGSFALQSADGLMVATTTNSGTDPITGDPTTTTTSGNFDERAAVPLGQTTSTTDNVTLQTTTTESNNIMFDAAGREISPVSSNWNYDTVDHVAGNGSSFNYAWGPNGHPMMSNPSGQNQTLHWEGGSLLFTTDPNGHLTDLKFGTTADILPSDPLYSGLTVWDRDLSGVAVSQHGSAGKGAWFDTSPVGTICSKTKILYCSATQVLATPAPSFTPSASLGGNSFPPPETQSPNSQPNYSVYAEPRTDGITDGMNIIQGIRAYDSINGIWNSRDALGADVGNPQSEDPYMYDGNNTAAFGDPSGTNPRQIPLLCQPSIFCGVNPITSGVNPEADPLGGYGGQSYSDSFVPGKVTVCGLFYVNGSPTSGANCGPPELPAIMKGNNSDDPPQGFNPNVGYDGICAGFSYFVGGQRCYFRDTFGQVYHGSGFVWGPSIGPSLSYMSGSLRYTPNAKGMASFITTWTYGGCMGFGFGGCATGGTGTHSTNYAVESGWTLPGINGNATCSCKVGQALSAADRLWCW